MEITQQPSTFADMIDRLRFKSEAELKQLYLQFFSKELKDEWKDLVKDADFKSASEQDIINAIQKNRYKNNV
jgi:beta-lactamase class A